MKRSHFHHGAADSGTPGMVMGHVGRYDLHSAIFYGGRRRRVVAQLASGASICQTRRMTWWSTTS